MRAGTPHGPGILRQVNDVALGLEDSLACLPQHEVPISGNHQAYPQPGRGVSVIALHFVDIQINHLHG